MKSLQLSKPHFIVVIGIPGSGKTTFAQQFSDTFHAPFVNPRSFMPYLGDAADTEVADLFTDKLLDIVLPSRQTVLYESLSGTRVERIELAKRARAAGYEPLFVWMQTDVQIARLRSTKGTRTQQAALSDAQFEQQLKRFSPPHTSEKYLAMSGMRTYASQVKPLLKRLTTTARPPVSPQVPLRPTEPRPDTAIRRSVKIS